MMSQLREKTLEIHGGSGFGDMDMRPSVYRSAAFPLGSHQRAKELFDGSREGYIYSRINNPTIDKLERRIASLEGAEAGLATSSGMSAIFLVALHLANQQHITSSNRLYGGVDHLFRARLPKLGITVSFVNYPEHMGSWQMASYSNTAFYYVEMPSNPIIDVYDLDELSSLAHSQNIPLVVDSTLATPALIKPLEHGADVVVHSLSKYIGDGEAIGGMILGKKGLIDEMRGDWFRDSGMCLSPDNAAIFCSHVESLHARMQEHCKNAETIAGFLSQHTKAVKVYYPSFSGDTEKHWKLMPHGFGGLLSFDVGSGENAIKVLESLKLFWHAANIGESRSLVIHPASTTHGQQTPQERSAAKITDGMLRLSVGREDASDLIDDLDQALDQI